MLLFESVSLYRLCVSRIRSLDPSTYECVLFCLNLRLSIALVVQLSREERVGQGKRKEHSTTLNEQSRYLDGRFFKVNSRSYAYLYML